MSFSVGQPEMSGLDFLLGQLGQGAGQGIQQSLERFHQEKQREKTASSLSQFIDKNKAGDLLNLPESLQKTAFLQELYNKEFGQPQSSNFGSDINNNPTAPTSKEGLDSLSDAQLTKLLGNPLYEKAAQNILNQRQDLKKMITKSDISRSEKYLDQLTEEEENTRRAKSSLSAIEGALNARDLGFFSPDNLKQMAGFSRWISPEGQILNTASKEFFLSDLERAIGRPNMFLEKILSNAITQVGKSNEANKAIVEFYKNQIDIQEEKSKIGRELENYYRGKLGYVPGNIGSLVNAQLKPYAIEKEKQLTNIFKRKPEEEIKEKIEIKEGTTARNKEGKRIIFKGGSWQPLQ